MAELVDDAVAAGTPVYKDDVLEIEPHGLEHIRHAERHGNPFTLFTLWFAANTVLATWIIGNLAVGVFGESMRGALLGLLIGNVAGGVLLGTLSTFGPRLGVPQMIQSRAAFGFLGNFGPGTLNYLAGIGWFAVNTVYGTYALVTLVRLNFFIALAIMVVVQVVLAVYGYNMIHLFERVMSLALGVVFFVLAIFTFSKGNFAAPFNPHASVPFGGEVGGFIITIGLALSYYLGWMPFASDYSRYLPQTTKATRAFLFTFLGSFIPCLALEWMGALTASIAMPAATAANPTSAIAFLMPGPLAGVALIAIVFGTLAANSLNIYSGAMSALVVHADHNPWVKALITGAIFGAALATLLVVSNATLASEQQPTLPVTIIIAAGVIIGVMVAIVVRFPLKRWHAAILVGVLGGLLSTGGSNPAVAAQDYSNFLLLLSYWITPWVAVVVVDWFLKHRRKYQLTTLYSQGTRVRAGALAWLAGLIISIPFWNQAWYVGPVPAHVPQVGDLSYLVSFVIAAVVYAIAGRPASQTEPAPSTVADASAEARI